MYNLANVAQNFNVIMLTQFFLFIYSLSDEEEPQRGRKAGKLVGEARPTLLRGKAGAAKKRQEGRDNSGSR